MILKIDTIMNVTALLFSVVLLVITVNVSGQSYSNQWVIKGDLSQHDIASIARRYGFTFIKKLLDDRYLFEKKDSPKSSKVMSRHLVKQIKQDINVEEVTQQEWQDRSLRQTPFSVSDASWSYMWYYNGPTLDIGMESVWRQGFDGSGMTIAIVDDGVDYNHPDLKDNYVKGIDVYSNDGDPKPAGQSHGTKCAGVAAAVKNTECVIGAAYKSNLAAIRLIGPLGDTDAGEQSAFTFPDVDIFSSSWGTSEGTKFGGPKLLAQQGLEDGIKNGRNKLGSIYVFAAGNGGFDDNCNADGYASSVYTIAITGVSRKLEPPGYGEPCAAALACAYSGPGGPTDPNNLCTTGLGNSCPCDFTGTSAAAPMAAGIFALVLQANPNLTWRDLQTLVVRTSITTGLTYGDFFTNGVGRRVSDVYGYGMLNATALIAAAKTWSNIDPNHVCKTSKTENNLQITSTIRTVNSSINTNGCNFTSKCVNSLEHVEARVSFWASLRGATMLTLTSPMGTSSKILTRRPGDNTGYAQLDWTFMSVQFWDEDPVGMWTLTMSMQRDIGETGRLISWDLLLHGTGEACTIPDIIKTSSPPPPPPITHQASPQTTIGTHKNTIDFNTGQSDKAEACANQCSEDGCDALCISMVAVGSLGAILLVFLGYSLFKRKSCKKLQNCVTPSSTSTLQT